MGRIDFREHGGSGPSRGRCYLYVLPCMYEDILKLGFSREPLDRMQTLHPRWFEFFDLDLAFLIETETVRDARNLETGLAGVIKLHNAPAPLVIRKQAGGNTEWYRGAYAVLERATQALAAGGYIVHRPLRARISQLLRSRGDTLFSWSSAMLSPDELETPNAGCDGRPTLAQRTVRNALDAYIALHIDLEPMLPPNVLDWYSRHED
ncbi:MAG: GIY-YIG nuclease family protein [Luteimonas sp.]